MYQQVPKIPFLMELDPTHMLWEDERGRVFDVEEHGIDWPVYDEAKGG